MADWLNNWQDDTLHLPEHLCLADCENIAWQQLHFPASTVWIDAKAVTKVDSVGIAALVALVRHAQAQAVEIKWTNIGQPLHNMLAVYELDNGVFRACRNN